MNEDKIITHLFVERVSFSLLEAEHLQCFHPTSMQSTLGSSVPPRDSS